MADASVTYGQKHHLQECSFQEKYFQKQKLATLIFIILSLPVILQ